MPIQQALAPDDLSAMQLLEVPDVWPPIDCPPVGAPEFQWPTGAASAKQAGDRTGEHTGNRTGEQAANQAGEQIGNRAGEHTGNRTGEQIGNRAGERTGTGPGEQADGGGAWPRQFAVLLAEALTGARPVRQILPWLTQRGTVHLYRLLPVFSGGQRARVQRIMTTQPSPDVIEMTLIVGVGPRTRALALRLTRVEPKPQAQWRGTLAARTAESRSATARWLCTDIEAG
jgi:Family of unknown function (DUF6459)